MGTPSSSVNNTNNSHPEKGAGQAKRDIFAIAGLPPEVLAVAMAKYSRSKESIRTTMAELTEEKSAEFHEKWVLGYGDASVADMAIIAIACENVSILASKAIEDNRLAAYQEKSTRYVDFDSTRYYRPSAIMAKHAELYERTIDDLFTTYRSLLGGLIEYMRKRFPKPTDITDKAYESKLKARSLDGVRYLLPAATLTNFGMIMSARSLRHAITKLMANPYQEIREIGEEIRQAALAPAHNPRSEKLKGHLRDLQSSVSENQQTIISQIMNNMTIDIKGAPTLIKHTDPSEYLLKTNEKLKELAVKIMRGAPVQPSSRVDYIEPHSYEDELITTLLYSATNYPYRQILESARKLSASEKEKIIDTVAECRSPYDQPRREYEIGGQLIFDVLMDYGAFRDLQRHRICTQINQPLTIDHGYETPFELKDAGLAKPFDEAISRFRDAYDIISRDAGLEADYMIPLASKKRTLYKMDLRELYHMVELRSKPGGHMSYRNIVLDMYNLVKKQHPMLVKHLRVVIPNYDEDFFKR